MTTQFNPSANGVLGLEWPVTVESAYAVDSPSKAMGAAVRSHAVETIDKASVYAAAVAGTAGYVMEVYPLAATEEAAVSTFTARPNEDASPTNAKNQAGGTTNLYQAIDEATLDLTDYLTSNSGVFGSPYVWRGRVATGSGNFTGRQILKLRMYAVAVMAPTGGGSVTFGLNINSVDYPSATQLLTDTRATLVATWEYNPATGLPWTIADAELFDTTDEVYVSLPWTAAGSDLFQVWTEWDHVPEQRLAVGKATITAPGYNEFNLSTPTGGTTWAKANTTDYLFTVRRLYGTGSASFRYLDSLADAPNGHHGYAVQVENAGGRLLELGAEFTRAFSIILTTSAPATSDDSQPYALRSLAAVYTGHSAEQEFLPPAANYGVVKAVIAAQAGVPSADLLIKVRRRSDSVQLGTTMVVAPEDLTGTVTTPRQVTVMMTAAALTAAQHYIELSTTAPNGQGWVVVLLDTTGTGSSATFGNTTHVATVGGVEDNDTDLAVVVAQIPAAPTNLVVSTQTDSVGHEYLRTQWDQTGLGASFDHYVLERLDDAEGFPVLGWQPIAAITSESVEEFDDYESRRGVPASYRLSVVHVNGIASATTAVATGTAG